MPSMKKFRIITRLNIEGPALHEVFLTSGSNGGVFESKLLAGIPDDHEGDIFPGDSCSVKV